MTPSAELAPDQLARVLRTCVVRIQAGTTTGTGFFIQPRQVLTCRHVVAAAVARSSAISVTGFLSGSGQPTSVPATVLDIPDGDWPDIAILGISESTADACVILDACEIPAGTGLMSGGFQDKTPLPYQGQLLTASLPAEGEGPRRQLRFLGDIVRPGASGSPLISLRSGLVVGIVDTTKSDTTMAGGFATMFTDVLDKLPWLQPLVDRPPSAAAGWIKAVGATTLKVVSDRDPKGARFAQTSALPRIDLTVEQDTTGGGNWQIGMQNARVADAGTRIPRSAADLGGDVIQAVDGWSRRQMITRPDEMQALGRVLDRALIAGEARTAVDDAVTVPPFLLRVCVDKAGGLSQLPWEYACGDGAVPLAADERLVFARFVDAPGSPPAPKEKLRVLAMIEIPSADFAEYKDESGLVMIRPSEQTFTQSLSDTLLRSRRVEFDSAVNMWGTALQEKLEEGWDVVHYLGFAWASGGKAAISVGCGKRPTFSPIPVGKLWDTYLAPSQCSVFVAEFHRAPLGQDPGPPADPGAFTQLVRDDLHAVVVTQNPVDLVDLGRFNDSFYEQISNGKSVELAVQAGRRAVRDGTREDPDVTAFGSFTVTTRRAGEVCLLTRATVTGGAQAGQPEASAAPVPLQRALETVESRTR